MLNPITRNLGHEISMTDLDRDAELATKSNMSSSDRLKQLTDSISSMSNRIMWLDADYATSITLDNGQITEWRDRQLNPLIQYEEGVELKATQADAGAPAQAVINVGDATRKALRFTNEGDALNINEVLDTVMTGPGISFSIAFAIKFSDIMHNDFFVNIIPKWDGDDSYSSFWVYLYDSPTTANLRFEIYSEDDSSNGVTIIGTDNIVEDRPYIVIVTYDASQSTGLDRCDIIINGRSVKSPTSFAFGDAFVDIIDGDASLQIGDHAGSDFAGYRSFNGDLYEVLFFNKKINSDEVHLITDYLAQKWGATQYIS